MTDLSMLDSQPAREMTVEEQDLADAFYAAVQHATNTTDRSLQSSAHRIGVSDLGFCSERVRRAIDGQTEPLVDQLPAFIGTALGDHIEEAIKERYPGLIRQAEVQIVLVGDGGTYELTGHPDLIDPRGRLIDVKTVRGLGKVRRSGPSQQQQFQRHCYAKAAHQAGLFNREVTLEQVQVANIWFDRAADERKAYVHSEPYDERIVQTATIWLDDVVYAYRHGESARKEPPIQMCMKACGFATVCRAGEGQTGGLIEDADQIIAVAMYREGIELEKAGRRLKDEAKAELQGVQGSTGHYSVKWTKVGSSYVAYERPSYERLDIRAVR